MFGKIRFQGIFGIGFPRVAQMDNQRLKYSVLYLKKISVQAGQNDLSNIQRKFVKSLNNEIEPQKSQNSNMKLYLPTQ
jgi:uncharacterized protein YlbG (UPF0298 family)